MGFSTGLLHRGVMPALVWRMVRQAAWGRYREVFMRILFLLVATVFAASGCAHVKFSDRQDEKNSMLKFYYAKPQLMMSVAKTCEVSFSSAPVVEKNPGYLKLVPGLIGSNNLTVALSNGVLTNVGQNTDSKLSDTASALGTFAKLVGVGMAASLKSGNERNSGEALVASDCAIEPGVYFVDSEFNYTRLSPTK